MADSDECILKTWERRKLKAKLEYDEGRGTRRGKSDVREEWDVEGKKSVEATSVRR